MKNLKRIAPEGQKWCPGHQDFVPVENFYKQRQKPDGLQGTCIDCCYYNNRKSHLSRYNITPEIYDSILTKQDFKCANPGCGAKEPGGQGSWTIDHDHSCCPERARSCGQCIRGLLCQRCNLALGAVGDNVERLTGLIQYLQDSQIHT